MCRKTVHARRWPVAGMWLCLAAVLAVVGWALVSERGRGRAVATSGPRRLRVARQCGIVSCALYGQPTFADRCRECGCTTGVMRWE